MTDGHSASPQTQKPNPRAGFILSSLGAFYSALLALGISLGPVALSVIIAIFAAVLVIGWPQVMHLPQPLIPRVVMIAATIGALAAANWGAIRHTMLVIIFTVIAAFIAEMLRRDGRPALIEHISATFCGAGVIIAGSLWIHTIQLGDADMSLPLSPGVAIGLTSAITIAVVALIHAFSGRAARVLGLINGLIVGAIIGVLLEVPLWAGAALGLSIGIGYAALRKNIPLGHTADASRMVGLVIPHCVTGAVGYLLTALVLI